MDTTTWKGDCWSREFQQKSSLMLDKEKIRPSRRSLRLLLVIVWGLIAMPVFGQVAGFSGPDGDRDGLPDDFEQAILEKFRPTWKIGSSDCNVLPAEFVPGDLTPSVKDRN